MAATSPQLQRAADESAAASPDENSCMSFKFLMEINTLSLWCIAQCNTVNNALCWIRQRNGVMHRKDTMTNLWHKACPCLNWYLAFQNKDRHVPMMEGMGWLCIYLLVDAWIQRRKLIRLPACKAVEYTLIANYFNIGKPLLTVQVIFLHPELRYCQVSVKQLRANLRQSELWVLINMPIVIVKCINDILLQLFYHSSNTAGVRSGLDVSHYSSSWWPIFLSYYTSLSTYSLLRVSLT